MKAHIVISIICIFLFEQTAFSQNIGESSKLDFWEEVEGVVSNPGIYSDNKLIKFRANDHLIINDLGVMFLWDDEGIIYLSQDDGQTWTKTDAPPYISNSFLKNRFSTDGSVFISPRITKTNSEQVIYISENGYVWEEIKSSQILNMKIFSESRNPMLPMNIYGLKRSNFTRLLNGVFGDFVDKNELVDKLELGENQEIRKIFCSDGSVKIDKSSRTFYFDDQKGVFTRNKPSNSYSVWTYIDEVYYMGDGKYYTPSLGINLISNDDESYSYIVTNFFRKKTYPTEDFKIYPLCGNLFAYGRKEGEYQRKSYLRNSDNSWSEIENNGGYLVYNKKTKRIYQYSNRDTDTGKAGLFRSKSTFECSCSNDNSSKTSPLPMPPCGETSNTSSTTIKTYWQEQAKNHLQNNISQEIKNQNITCAYAEMYLKDPAKYKWAGLAALAGC